MDFNGYDRKLDSRQETGRAWPVPGGMGLEEGHPALDHPAGFLNHHVVCDPVKPACHLSVPRKAEQHRGKNTEDLRQTLILTPHRYLCSSGQVEPTLRLLRIKKITLSTSKGHCKD